MNLFTLFEGLTLFLKCKTCDDIVKFQEKSIRGLGFKIQITCKNCVPKETELCIQLTNDDLLDRYVGAFNHNNNENFNALIWDVAPKTIVKIATNIVVCKFNDGTKKVSLTSWKHWVYISDKICIITL